MGDRAIRIMLLVGSNGKASACIEGDMGWGDLADNIMDFPTRGPGIDPAATSRNIITVSVPEPVIAEITGEVAHD